MGECPSRGLSLWAAAGDRHGAGAGRDLAELGNGLAEGMDDQGPLNLSRGQKTTDGNRLIGKINRSKPAAMFTRCLTAQTPVQWLKSLQLCLSLGWFLRDIDMNLGHSAAIQEGEKDRFLERSQKQRKKQLFSAPPDFTTTPALGNVTLLAII